MELTPTADSRLTETTEPEPPVPDPPEPETPEPETAAPRPHPGYARLCGAYWLDAPDRPVWQATERRTA